MAPASSAPPPPSPPPPPPPAQRKSRVLKRKTDHSLIERRRREKINERLIRLQTLVPACYAEALDVLRAKPLPAARRRTAQRRARAQASQRPNASHRPLPGDDEPGEWTMAEMAGRIESDMVLEKLCIISHTYDYVCELRQQLDEYRRICANLAPPAGAGAEPSAAPAGHGALSLNAEAERQTDQLAKAKHYAFAHALVDDPAAEGSTSDRASPPNQPASPSSMHVALSHAGSHGSDAAQEDVSAEKEHKSPELASGSPPPQPTTLPASFPLCCPSHRRRAQRFWGSDHPIPILPQSSGPAAPPAEVSPRSSLSSVAGGTAALGRARSPQAAAGADGAHQSSSTSVPAPRASAPPHAAESKDTGSTWPDPMPRAHPAGPAPPSPCSSTSSLAFEDEDLSRVPGPGPVGPTGDKALASPLSSTAKMSSHPDRPGSVTEGSPALASPSPSTLVTGGDQLSAAPSLKRPLEPEDSHAAKRPRSLSPLNENEKKEEPMATVRTAGQSPRPPSPPAHQHHHHHHYYMHILPPPGTSSVPAVSASTKGESSGIVALAPASTSQGSQSGPRPHIHLALAPLSSPPRGALPFHPPPAPARPLGSHPHLHAIQRAPRSRASQDRLHLLAHLAQPAPPRRCGSE